VQRLLLLAFSLAAFLFITGAYSPDAVNSAENNAKLKNIPSSAAPFIMRMGFAVAGDAPPLLFKSSNAACSLNAGNGDDGSQVKSLDSNGWLSSPIAAGSTSASSELSRTTRRIPRSSSKPPSMPGSGSTYPARSGSGSSRPTRPTPTTACC
jgi:hypothetical protein